LGKIEKEFNMKIELEEPVKHSLVNSLSQKIAKEGLDTFETTDHLLKELKDISEKLGITNQSDKKAFISNIFQIKDNELLEKENKLKILYFMIKAELERLDRIKNRIDSKSTFRIRAILFILFTLLVAQTSWFYYMIFHVDFLGWDLVEPTTFLVSSLIFMIGLFSYIKLNRSAISSEHIVKGFKNKYYLKMYLKENFNIDRYIAMEKQVNELQRAIDMTKRL
jgi:hypothetical protein